jgi:ribonuclease III
MTLLLADDSAAAWLRQLLGESPQQPALFVAALTHRSAGTPNSERLELLGDAVLGLVVIDELLRRFPAADEGALSRLRSQLVSAPPLAQIGAEIGIGDVLKLGSGEMRTGGFRRESILADAVEALIGARYQDAGLGAAQALVLKLLGSRMAMLRPSDELKDSKTRLQEFLQGRGEALPEYLLLSATGEPHAQTFTVGCVVKLSGGATFRAEADGLSRRRAEQDAAGSVLRQLQQSGWS